MMSEPKTNEQTEAAVERIKQLTETMVAAARTAGAGVLEAHEKALRGLADFKPREPARAAFEWVQALAEVHAKFIEEASSAYVTAAREARAQVPAAVADAAVVKQIRDLNERILARARDAGSKALDGYETALRGMAEFETKVAGASQLDWVKALAASHARFLTDVGALYANALRSPLSNRSEPAPSPEE
jgi:hypothetical protein